MRTGGGGHGWAGRTTTSSRRTTVRIIIDESRRPWRRESPVEAHRLDRAATAGPETATTERDAMVRALASLTPRRRACVVLRYYHDLSVADTARALGCSEGTVKSQTSDALRALRPLVDPVDLPGAGVGTGTHHD